MSFSPDDLAQINQAIATGELSIERNGVRVIYRNMDDLRSARRLIEDDLQRQGVLVGAGRRPSATYVQFERD